MSSAVAVRPLGVSFFSSIRSREPEGRAIPWSKLSSWLCDVRVHDVDDKRDLPVWSPVSYTDGATRGSAGVESVSCLVLDYDDGTSIEDAERTWAPWAHVVHTSWSHTVSAPRFRVVLPLAGPVDRADWPGVWTWAHARSPNVDAACKDAGRIYFVPARRSQDAPWYSRTHDGPWLDPSQVVVPDQSGHRQRRSSPTTRASRAVCDALKNDHGARSWAAGALGAVTTGEPPRADKIQCPSCGDASVWFFLAPGQRAGADCKHLNSCGWSGFLDELLDAHGVDASHLDTGGERRDPGPDRGRRDDRDDSPGPLALVEALTRDVAAGRVDSDGFGARCVAIARACATSGAPSGPMWDLALATLEEAAHAAPGFVRVRERVGLIRKIGGAPRQDEDPLRTGRKDRPSDVMEHLDVKEDGTVLPHLLNITRILTLDPRWRDALWFDDFLATVMADGRPVTDAIQTEISLWLAETYQIHVPTVKVGEAVDNVARKKRRHVVREWLRSLQWDGERRLHKLLSGYLGAQHMDLTAAIGTRWMLSAVARVAEPGTGWQGRGGPGCKVDAMLVLVGAQGCGKSTALSILGGDWFRDSDLRIGDGSDQYLQLRGAWIYEAAEVDGWNKRQQAEIKAFLSSAEDYYRAPYGKHPEPHPRQVVFGGTTNKMDFLADPTGSRRFLPVRVGEIDVAALRRDRDQLWAEAVALYDAGEPWHLDAREADLLSLSAEMHRQVDAWEEAILKYVAQNWPAGLTTADVLRDAVMRPLERQTHSDVTRAGSVMRRAGYESSLIQRAGVRVRLWHPAGQRPPC